MSQILVINTGSSSIKASLYEVGAVLKCVGNWHLKGLNTSSIQLESCGQKETLDGPLNIEAAFDLVFSKIWPAHLQAICHRFVHGGDKYRSTVQLNVNIIEELSQLTQLAPLHNPPCLTGIRVARQFFAIEEQHISQWAIFDTAFYHNMPKRAAHYAIPTHIAENNAIKRFGFHGVAHAFLWQQYVALTKHTQARVITIHLGSGCSMTAIKAGIAQDTSMGLTPSEGLMMSTRAGDIDAAVVEILATRQKSSPEEVMHILNFESGLLGVSGKSADLQQLLKQEDANSAFAIDLFCYRIVKYIGSYIAVLGGVDALIFSGGIGEHAASMRKKIIADSAWSGAVLDQKANADLQQLASGQLSLISASSSKINIYVACVDENLAMAKELVAILT